MTRELMRNRVYWTRAHR